jgi:hypothetical protein
MSHHVSRLLRGPMRSWMCTTDCTVDTQMYLARLSNIKSKVRFVCRIYAMTHHSICICGVVTLFSILQIIGSRGQLNVIKALFIA